MLLFALGCSPPPTVTVLAASSLAPALAELEAGFEAAHPGVDVAVSFAGSHTLALQVEQGLSADVFVSADARSLARAGVRRPTTVATNEIGVVFGPSWSGPATFAALGTVPRVVIADRGVPLGDLTHAAFGKLPEAVRAQVEHRVVSREPSAASTFTKLRLGEADAAVLFKSDAQRLPAHRWTPLEQHTAYRAGALSNSVLGSDWLTWLKTPAAVSTFRRHGFGAPP